MKSGKTIQSRWMELLVAAFFALCAVLVITDSQRVGNAWGDDGPQPGYFPFYIGTLMFAGAAWVILQTVLSWRKDAGKTVFAEVSEFKLMLCMLLPSVLYVAAIYFLGIYLASWIFVAAFMVWQGKYSLLRSSLVGFSISASLFLLFEVWFLMPLPKGPIENWLGY